MRKILKKVLSSILLVSILSGCGASKSSESVNESGVINDDFSEKMTLNFNVVDTEIQDKDARYDYLKEKFNIDFELIACNWGDVKEKVRIWVASGDMPEMMWSEINSANELKTWIDSGQLLDLSEVINNYPNLKAIQDNIKTDDTMFNNEGKRYFLSTGKDMEPVNFRVNQLFFYRKDWAQALGLDKESYTWEELQELAVAMIEEDPGNNGVGKTYGIGGSGFYYPGFVGLEQNNRYWNEFYKGKDGKYTWGGDDEATLEGLRDAKGLYDSGALWNEQGIAQVDDAFALFTSGQMGIHYGAYNGNYIQQVIASMESAYPDKNIEDIMGVMKVTNDNDNITIIEGKDSWGQVCFRADIAPERLHRYLTMLDYLASEEGVLLQRYGVEGTDYEIDNGEIKILWEKDENGNFINPYEVNSDRVLSLSQLNEFEKCFTELVPPSTQSYMEEMREIIMSDNIDLKEFDYEMQTKSGKKLESSTLGDDLDAKVTELLVTTADKDEIVEKYLEWVGTQRENIDGILEELNN
ncbi:MAG: extracellular solute-binding protein [Lachnospirales bacterium]